MKNSEKLITFKKVYNEVFGSHEFAGSEIQQEAFGKLLSATLRGTGFYCFSDKTLTDGWATFICPCTPEGYIPGSDEQRKGDKITVLLHWGMNYEFLDDLESWGHEKCPYKVVDVDYSVVDLFQNTFANNYFDLYDAVENYKETGVWEIEEEVY